MSRTGIFLRNLRKASRGWNLMNDLKSKQKVIHLATLRNIRKCIGDNPAF